MVYVGLTTHLWMVTKRRLPRSGGARPGQRYGRPKYAGTTRQRVNVLIADQIALRLRALHWLRPLAEDRLRAEEEALIRRWRLGPGSLVACSLSQSNLIYHFCGRPPGTGTSPNLAPAIASMSPQKGRSENRSPNWSRMSMFAVVYTAELDARRDV